MAVSWNEAVNGDLSDVISTPTALGSVSQGDNIITGALPNSPEDDEQDEFSFVVPDGLVVENIIVTQLDTTGFENGFSLFLRNADGLVGGLNTANSGLQAGDNLFDKPQFRFSGPLLSGTYAFDLRGFTTSFGANAYEFKLVVLPTNIVPVATNDTASTNEDTAVTLNVLGNDSDANGETLRITQVNGQAATVGTPITLPSGALVTLNANGTLSFNPNGKYNSLAQGATTTQLFTYTISDGRRGTTPATATATITITGLNDAATISGTATGAVTEDAATPNLITTGTLTVSDPDAGQNTFNTTVTRASSNLGSLNITEAGAWSYSVANSATQFLGAGATKTDTFIVASSDGTASQNIVVTINGVNDTATISGITTGAVTEDAATPNLTTTGSLTVSDPDTGQNTFNTTVTSTSGNLGSLSITGAGAWSYSVANSATQFLGAGATKTDTFTVQSVDGTANQNIAVTITGLNDAPVADPLSLTATQGTPFTIALKDLLVQNVVRDIDRGDVLSITGVSDGVGGTPTLNNDGTIITFNPIGSGNGGFTYTLSDDKDGTTLGTVNLLIGSRQLGGNSIDTLYGNAGPDFLDGGNGDDTLYGNAGNDTLLGRNGADRIFGGDGDDLIDGGNGPNVLTGGTGSDRFVLAANSGGDTITDFADGVDRIALSGGLTFGRLTLLGSNNNTLIQLNGTTLTTLTNINPSLITAGDFTTV